MTRPQQSGTGKTFRLVPPLPLTTSYMRCSAQILLPAGFSDRQYTSSLPQLVNTEDLRSLYHPLQRRLYARRPPLPDLREAEGEAVAVRRRFTINRIGNTEYAVGVR